MRLASAMYSSHVLRTRRRPGIGGSQSGSWRRRDGLGLSLRVILHVAQCGTAARTLALALAQHVDHHVERARELAHLVVGTDRDVRAVVVAALQCVRRGGES